MEATKSAILRLREQGASFTSIAAQLGLTKGQVSGVIFRATSPKYTCAPRVSVRKDLIAALRAALEFIEDEAENRASAGSAYSDYEREPRELAERIRLVVAVAEAA